MSMLPPISQSSSTQRNTLAAAAAANRRVSFNVPQLVSQAQQRPSDSVEDSAMFSCSGHTDMSAGSGTNTPGDVLEGRDCARTGVHNGRFSLTSRSRLNSVGNTFHLSDEPNNVHIARRIWGGRVDNISHGEMLQRVRGQFKRQNEREHLPLVLPAQIPSSERAPVPQLPKFSRGIRQYKRVHGTLGFDGSGSEADTGADHDDDGADAGAWGAAAAGDGERASSAPPVMAREAADRAETMVQAALGAGPVTPLTAAQLEAVAAAAALGGGAADRTAPATGLTPTAAMGGCGGGLSTPLGWSAPAARRRASSARRASVMQADAPLGALATYEERWQRLRELEQLERLHIMSTERWDYQVVVEMMVAHYVSFVLKPEMEELQARERMIRGFITYEEEHERYDLFNTHPLATTLQTELRALEAKKLKLSRIRQLQRGGFAVDGGSSATTPLRPVPEEEKEANALAVAHDSTASAPENASTTAAVAVPAPSSPRRPSEGSHTSAASSLASAPLPKSTTTDLTVVTDVAAPHGSSSEATMPTTTAEDSHNTDDARLILQRYARRKHAQELKETEQALGGHTTTTQAKSGTAVGLTGTNEYRRPSELVVPLESVAARAPRRNTVGIADYIALLDEDGMQRTIIVQSERSERSQIYALLQDELAVVMDWQRKRMHLERLLYWRNLREEQVRQEVETLTDLTDPRAVDPKTALLLSTIEEGEEEDRDALIACEAQELEDLAYWSGVLHVSATGDDLVGRYAAVQLAVWEETYSAFATALVELEASCRSTLMAEEASAWQDKMLAQGDAVRALYDVSVDPAQYAAVHTLQRAFKASLNGRLGRHYTNVQVGRDVQAARNARKIERGKTELRTFQQQLLDEEAAIVAEIEAEHAKQRAALSAAEQRNRIAMSSEEEWSFAVVRRTGERSAEEALLAWRRRLLKEEHTQRLQIDVVEEMAREPLQQCATQALVTVVALDTLMETEAAEEATLVDEQLNAWTALSSSEYDERELIRIDAEEKARESHAAATAESERAEQQEEETEECHGHDDVVAEEEDDDTERQEL